MALIKHLKMDQGVTWEMAMTSNDYTGRPIDLTGSLLRCHFRQRFRDPSPSLIADCQIVDAKAGKAVIRLSGEQTERIYFDTHERVNRPVQYVYDVVMQYADGRRRVLMRGNAEIYPLATRVGDVRG